MPLEVIQRDSTDQEFGQLLSDSSVVSLEKSLHCDVRIICRYGLQLTAHQCILTKSPTLKAALQGPEVASMPEAKLIFPEFQKTSLSLLLQFLYTGEVELQSGSSVLVEFQELCKILKVNPKVIKNRNEDGYEQPGRSSSYNWKCGACGRILSSRTKYIFHRQQCRKVQSKPSLSDESGFRSGASSSSTKKSAAESYALTQKIQKIPAGGEGPSGSSSKSSSKAVVKKSSASDKFEEAGGFRMPDNYDLPDYVIQEKFAKGESSTPLPAKTKPAPKPQTGKKGQYHEGSSAFVKKSSQKSSTKKNEPTSKPSSSLTTNERATPSSLSVAAELAAKKERMLMKLKGDRGGPSTSGGAADYVRQKPTTAKRKSDSGSSRDRVSRMSGKKKKKYDEEDEEDAFWSSSSESDASLPNDPEDDDSFQGSQGRPRRARRERQQYKEYLYDSSFEIYKNDKKIRVSAQVEGNETILELSQYKFQLLHKDDGASSSDEVEACKDAVPKEIHDEVTDEIDAVDKKSLAKHGKRILMMAGESSSSEEEEIPSQRDHDHQDKPKVEVKAVKDSIGGPSSQSNKNKSGNESSASSEKKMLPSEPAAATSSHASSAFRNLNMPPPVPPVGLPPATAPGHIRVPPAPSRNTLSGFSFRKKQNPASTENQQQSQSDGSQK